MRTLSYAKCYSRLRRLSPYLRYATPQRFTFVNLYRFHCSYAYYFLLQGADSPLDTERDVFVVNLGGFDTHSDLLEDFSANMQVRIYVTLLFFFVNYGRWIMRLLAALFTTPYITIMESHSFIRPSK